MYASNSYLIDADPPDSKILELVHWMNILINMLIRTYDPVPCCRWRAWMSDVSE